MTERRRFLREMLDGPIYFTPDGTAYHFTGKDRRGRLVAGLIDGLLTGTTISGVPTGIRTRVSALKGPRPRPLDDGDVGIVPLPRLAARLNKSL